MASDGVVLCPTASCPCTSGGLLEVVFAAHDAVHESLLVGDEVLCLELLLLGVELRDLRDELTSTSHGCRVAAAMLTETTLMPALVDAVRDPRTPIHSADLLTRVAFGLRRAWASADSREPCRHPRRAAWSGPHHAREAAATRLLSATAPWSQKSPRLDVDLEVITGPSKLEGGRRSVPSRALHGMTCPEMTNLPSCGPQVCTGLGTGVALSGGRRVAPTPRTLSTTDDERRRPRCLPTYERLLPGRRCRRQRPNCESIRHVGQRSICSEPLPDGRWKKRYHRSCSCPCTHRPAGSRCTSPLLGISHTSRPL